MSAIDAFSGISVARLSEVFDLVKPHPVWKGRIAARIPKTAASREEIEAAVVFYAGGVPDIIDSRGSHWHVLGAGYYEWIGA